MDKTTPIQAGRPGRCAVTLLIHVTHCPASQSQHVSYLMQLKVLVLLISNL